jgi:hypothetical protein
LRLMPEKVPYAEYQPEPGEIILKCGHQGRRRWHFFRYSRKLRFNRPDGTSGESRWLCVCDECLAAYPEPQAAICSDFDWDADGPRILKGVQ